MTNADTTSGIAPNTTTYTASVTVAPSKAWYASKANWTAIATFLAGIGPVLMATSSGIIGDQMAMYMLAGLSTASAVVQFVLRTFFTNTAIAV